MKFFKAINWKKLFNIIFPVILFLVIVNLSNSTPHWGTSLIIVFLFFIMLLLTAHSHYIMNKPKSPAPTLKEVRIEKLKKIKRKNKFKFI